MTLQRMREYELVMILSPESTEMEARDTVSRISDIITEGGGSISTQDNWGIRRLAYPIQRFVEGNYFITRCSMEAQTASELNSELNSTQEVLRHLVFKLEKSEIAAIELQAQREREAREKEEARARSEREARERDEARRTAAAMAAERARAEQNAANQQAAEPRPSTTDDEEQTTDTEESDD